MPESAIAFLADKVEVYPTTQALATACDRIREKRLFHDLGVPTVSYAPVNSFDELEEATKSIGLPAILKTRTLGYDGKGQVVLRSSDKLESVSNQLGGVPLILEGFANFEQEISVIGVRGRDGVMRFYPLSKNHHRNGILHTAHSLPDDPR